MSTFATNSIFKRNLEIIDTKSSNMTLSTAHRIFNLYQMHQVCLIFIFFFSVFFCLYSNVPLFNPLWTLISKAQWNLETVLFLLVYNTPISLLYQAVKSMLEAKLLVCQILNTCRILTLVICYIRVEILFFNTLSTESVWQAKIVTIN